MDTAIQVIEEPLTAVEIRAQVNRIQEVMKAVMSDGTHYGTIPGCGTKPTLLKPGAEKLATTFRLAVDPHIEDLSDLDLGLYRYRITARITSQSTGRFLGAGVGECSSEEEKYRWREAVCKEEWTEADPTDRRDKWKRGKDGQPYVLHQVKTNEADLANTLLKMAKKRALVDAILTVTAASDIFTQDIEDMPEEIVSKKAETAAAPLKANTVHVERGFPPNVFASGKHFGKLPTDVPASYLTWYRENVKGMRPELATAIDEALRTKTHTKKQSAVASPDELAEHLEADQELVLEEGEP